jgi:hypothetical protein
MSKRNKNLSLDEEAVRRGEEYSQLHATSVSRLVNDFLSSLPVDLDEDQKKLSPAVRRLLGLASGQGGNDAYRSWLTRKYGQ